MLKDILAAFSITKIFFFGKSVKFFGVE